MVGERNHIQVGLLLNVRQNLFDGGAAVTIRAVHMQVGLSLFADVLCLLRRHFSSFLQHGCSDGCVFQSFVCVIVCAHEHVILFLLLSIVASVCLASSSHDSHKNYLQQH